MATIVFGLLGILYGALRLYGTIVTENPERCADVADFFERKGYRDRYATILNFSLRKLSKYFHKPLSGHALDRCIVIAGSYTYLSFLIAGAAGYRGHIFGEDFIVYPPQPFSIRIAGLAILLAALFLGYFFWRNERRFSYRYRPLVIFAGGAAYAAVGVFVSMILSEGTGIPGAAIGVATGLGILLVAAVLAGQIPILGRLLVAAGAVALVLALGFDKAGAAGTTVAAFVGIFALATIAPVVNGLFDWLSWAASRHLAAALKNEQTLRRFVTHILVFDTGLAMVLMAFVPATMFLGLTATNVVLGGLGVEVGFAYAPILSLSSAQPFGPQGLFITLMLLSNLVPTILHMAAAFGALPLSILLLKTKMRVSALTRNKDAILGAIVLIGSLFLGLIVVLGVFTAGYFLLRLIGFDVLGVVYGMACWSAAHLGAACASV